MKYKRYHSSIKVAYTLGLERQFLPRKFRENIAPSTSHYWKHDKAQFIGQEFASLVHKNLNDIQYMYDHRVVRTRRIFTAICRIQITFMNLMGKDHFKSIIIKHRDSISQLIDQVSDTLGGVQQVCKHFQLSVSTYTTWKRYRHLQCPSSPLNLCFKKVPQQITFQEISNLKKYMTDARFTHWSMASVWGCCFRNGDTSMSRSTWYHYCQLLGISAKRKRRKKKQKRNSIQAHTINTVWHMDLTYVKTLDNFQYFVYTVVDNFSRKILSYDVSNQISGEIRVKSLRRAIAQEFPLALSDGAKGLQLIVDGGSENNNKTIDAFIKSSMVDIEKKVALRDVTFSNSVVEGSFRILKQTYLGRQDIYSHNIHTIVAEAIEDTNERRPHYVHDIYTPSEIHQNPELKGIKPSSKNAIAKRVSDNRQFGCFKAC